MEGTTLLACELSLPLRHTGLLPSLQQAAELLQLREQSLREGWGRVSLCPFPLDVTVGPIGGVDEQLQRVQIAVPKVEIAAIGLRTCGEQPCRQRRFLRDSAAMRSRTVSKTHPAGIQHSSSVTSNVPAILASLWSTPLQQDARPFGGPQPPQMREDGTALRGGKAGQINNDGVEPLLQQMLGNLPQKAWTMSRPAGTGPTAS